MVNFDIKLLVLHKSVASSRVACARGEAIVVHGHVLQVLVAWARSLFADWGPPGGYVTTLCQAAVEGLGEPSTGRHITHQELPQGQASKLSWIASVLP